MIKFELASWNRQKVIDYGSQQNWKNFTSIEWRSRTKRANRQREILFSFHNLQPLDAHAVENALFSKIYCLTQCIFPLRKNKTKCEKWKAQKFSFSVDRKSIVLPKTKEPWQCRREEECESEIYIWKWMESERNKGDKRRDKEKWCLCVDYFIRTSSCSSLFFLVLPFRAQAAKTKWSVNWN